MWLHICIYIIDGSAQNEYPGGGGSGSGRAVGKDPGAALLDVGKIRGIPFYMSFMIALPSFIIGDIFFYPYVHHGH